MIERGQQQEHEDDQDVLKQGNAQTRARAGVILLAKVLEGFHRYRCRAECHGDAQHDAVHG